MVTDFVHLAYREALAVNAGAFLWMKKDTPVSG